MIDDIEAKRKLDNLNIILQNIICEFMHKNKFFVEKVEIISEHWPLGGNMTINTHTSSPVIELSELVLSNMEISRTKFSKDLLKELDNKILFDELIDRTKL